MKKTLIALAIIAATTALATQLGTLGLDADVLTRGEYSDDHIPAAVATPNATTATTTLDSTTYRAWTITLQADTLIAVTGLESGKDDSVKIKLIQDATGGRTVTWSNTVWQYGYVPVITPTSNAVDVVWLTSEDGGTNCVGYIAAQDIK